MTRREPWLPPTLAFFTCGIYMFYWQYVTTEELKRVSGREDLNPMMDLLLGILCCGFWAIYVQYRNAQVVHEVFQRHGRPHEDKSTMVLLMHALSFVTGMTGLVAMMILQDDFNKLEELAAPRTF